ncbi:MAG: DUF2791 family P-loop domain-containing protein [Candidatus Atribacteria bacterium]|nr:DUF2791 family P-loop domain-containing protein [Candidatus Atribacteria bacterium]
MSVDDIEKKQRDAIFIIESLRAGVPTRLATRELPDLRKNITDTIRMDLDSFSPDHIPEGRIVWGDYGQGKTHVLTAAEHVALDSHFAVSRVSLSREVSCHILFNFYKRVAPIVKTPNTHFTGIQTYLNKKKGSEITTSVITEPGRYIHPLPVIILEDYFYTDGEEQDKLYADLMGIRIPRAELKRIHRASRKMDLPKHDFFRHTEHTSAYFGVLADAIQFCGFKGWVILIDEVELIGRLGKVSRMKACRNLNWLLNWNKKMNYPIYTIIAAASNLQVDLWYGVENGDPVIMPLLAKERIGTEAASEMSQFFEKATGKSTLQVEPPDEIELIQLLNKIVSLHGMAYQWTPEFNTTALLHQLGSETVRTYIRATLEALDLKMLYNEDIKPEAAPVTELKLVENESFFSPEEQ